MKLTKTTTALLAATDDLVADLEPLRFGPPVTHVYNPLVYARPMLDRYLLRFARRPKRVVFMGMNPGPWGMAQTGIPFGEVAVVRDFLKLDEPIGSPPPGEVHPKRPVEGLACKRSEVSGRRLWGLFADRFGSAEAFFNAVCGDTGRFAEPQRRREGASGGVSGGASGGVSGGVSGGGHLVVNYCPLVFMEASGRNFTPDKLPVAEREPLEAACDRHLRRMLETLRPEHVVGVGKFAQGRAQRVVDAMLADDADTPATASRPQVSTVLHPSPASPAANRGWADKAARQLVEAGVWGG